LIHGIAPKFVLVPAIRTSAGTENLRFVRLVLDGLRVERNVVLGLVAIIAVALLAFEAGNLPR
jgi:hypothetical protein